MLLGQVVGGRQAVAAATDDDHVVRFLRRGVSPRPWPMAVAPQRVGSQAEQGIARHRHRRQARPVRSRQVVALKLGAASIGTAVYPVGDPAR